MQESKRGKNSHVIADYSGSTGQIGILTFQDLDRLHPQKVLAITFLFILLLFFSMYSVHYDLVSSVLAKCTTPT